MVELEAGVALPGGDPGEKGGEDTAAGKRNRALAVVRSAGTRS
ncbi:MAG: hypothetical protein ACRDYA_02925 [Egibacteraceae bacterium]